MAIMAYDHEYSQYLYYICVLNRPSDENILFLKKYIIKQINTQLLKTKDTETQNTVISII